MDRLAKELIKIASELNQGISDAFDDGASVDEYLKRMIDVDEIESALGVEMAVRGLNGGDLKSGVDWGRKVTGVLERERCDVSFRFERDKAHVDTVLIRFRCRRLLLNNRYGPWQLEVDYKIDGGGFELVKVGRLTGDLSTDVGFVAECAVSAAEKICDAIENGI